MHSTFLTSIMLPLFLFACNKKSSEDSKSSNQPENTPVEETGSTPDGEVSSPSAGSLIISATLSASTIATHVAAFPVQGGGVSSQALQGLKTQPVTAGVVAISIDEVALHLLDGEQSYEGNEGGQNGGEVSHVLVAYKEGADRFETGESFKFINVPVGESEALNLFTSEVKTDKLDLGQIGAKGDKLVAGNAIKDGDFNIETAVLEELAASDDSLRSIKNAHFIHL